MLKVHPDLIQTRKLASKAVNTVGRIEDASSFRCQTRLATNRLFVIVLFPTTLAAEVTIEGLSV
jgi:hypothetical protein